MAGGRRLAVPEWLRGLVALALIAAGLLLLAAGLARTGTRLTIEVDGVRYQVRTHATVVGDALRRAGVDLLPEDRVSPAPAASLNAGTVLRVQRARLALVHTDAETEAVRTHAGTAGELLTELSLELHPADEVWLNGARVGAAAPLWPATLAPDRQPISRGGRRIPPRAEPAEPPFLSLRRATPLTLNDDGRVVSLRTTLGTVGEVLEEAGVTVYLADLVEPELRERITAGMTVTIHRSVPVQVAFDGRTIHTRTRAATVAGVLGQEGIALVGKDRAVPDLSAAVHPRMTIRVIRVREEIAVEFEPIPYDTIWVGDPEVEIDTTRLAQEGQAGLNKRRYRTVYEDGREVSRVLEDSWAERPPVTKTLAYGTKIVIRTLDTPDGPIEYWRKIRVYTTSYTAASSGKPKSHPRYGYTRLGQWLTKGIVAVDPTVIPLKTRLYVPGYGLARAGDTGGGVKGKFVDLGFDAWNYQSWHWWTDVYLLTPVLPRDQILWVLPNWPRYPDRKRR